MIVFATCLRHPERSADYGRVEFLLKNTLASVCAQEGDSYHVIVVGHVIPSFSLPPNVTFVRVNFPPPPLTDGAISRADFRIDKGKKIAVAAAHARKLQATYLALFDADDFVSRRLASFIDGQSERGSWFIERGYSCSARSGILSDQRNFHMKCGTSIIFDMGHLNIPDVEDLSDHEDILARTGKVYFSRMYGSHIQAVRSLQRDGVLFRPVPFPAAVYLLETGENHSGNRLRDADYIKMREDLMEEFSLPDVLRAPNKDCEPPPMAGPARKPAAEDWGRIVAAGERLLGKRSRKAFQDLIAQVAAAPELRGVMPLLQAMELVSRHKYRSAWRALRDHQGDNLIELRPEIYVEASFGCDVVQGRRFFDRIEGNIKRFEIISRWRIARLLLLHKIYDLFEKVLPEIADERPVPKWIRQELEWTTDFLANRRRDNRPLASGPSLACINYRAIDPDASSTNIGDWVQTLAFMGNLARFTETNFFMDGQACEFMRELQTMVLEADSLRSGPNNVNLIVTSRDSSTYEEYPNGTWIFVFGWYMHALFGRRYDLPLNEALRPIFLSFHLNKVAALSDRAAAQMVRYGPVGCRDWHTVRLLRKRGIPAFFSGCITSTLGNLFRQNPGAREGGVVGLVEATGDASGQEVRMYHHKLKTALSGDFLDNMEAAKRRLAEYTLLSRIYTSRLHCYLPAASMGVPVSFRPKDPNDIRFEGLTGITPENVSTMADPIRRLVKVVVEAIGAGHSEDEVYSRWRAETAALAVQPVPR